MPGIAPCRRRIYIPWHIDDLFFDDDPGTLIIDYEIGSETIITSDTFYEWTVPAHCDSVSVRVAVRDSFCNWGYDECYFPIQLPSVIGHIIVQGTEDLIYLRVIDSTDAIAAENGVIMVRIPDIVGAADIVDTTDVDASPILTSSCTLFRAG